MDLQSAQPLLPGFSVAHQRVELDFDLLARRLKGKTEITINPHSKDLKSVRFNCRQCNIKRITINNKPCSNFVYEEPYNKSTMPWKAGVHQHHMLKNKIDSHFKSPPDGELVINLPKSVKIEELDPFAIAASTPLAARSSVGLNSKDDPLGEGLSARTAIEQDLRYKSFAVDIEFTTSHIRDGMQFVGWEEEDLRYPHAYTKSFSAPGGVCCLFPCLDDLAARCTWEISIKCSKTLGDAFSPPRSNAPNGTRDGVTGVHKDIATAALDPIQSNMSAEDQALEISVICTGDLTDEVDDPVVPAKKKSTFSCASPLSAQQLGFTIGPFEHVDLAEFRESGEDDKLGQNAVPLHGFCLPGRAEEVRNTCLPMAKAIDFFTLEYGSYPFSNYKLCFVDDISPDIIHTGFLTVCSNNLLFPPDIIDPLECTCRQLTHALASQWMGVSVIPKEPTDTWVVVGIAFFMTDAFLRKLFGKNDYGSRQKQTMDRVVDLDIGRPSIYDTGAFVALDPFEAEFLELKAPLVLSILDRRFTKTGSASGLSRTISRVFMNATVGDLANGAISTAYFAKTCEKLGHAKLESFFAQWVYGAGCPRFRVAQKFNKKKNVVEMLITQIQAEPPERDLEKDTFMRDVKEDIHNVYAGPLQPVFTGPMTICIHEADGSPYEHLIEIKEAVTKVDINYNTKYKRLKRSKRQKERIVTAGGADYNPDGNDDVLLYCLGDVLQSEEEIQQWRLADWSKEVEDQMSQESYEWIRMDSNFEWICRIQLNLQGYMYLSQLQQDKDVVAQLESVQYMASQKTHPLISTIMLRTLMDTRYFHGVRTAAADALVKHAKEGDMDWLGLFHLEKAFQHFFCYNDSPMPRPNDFLDRAAYFIQCAIPKAIAKVRDSHGRSPIKARMFLLDKLKFNDNSDNEFSDCHYLATLMEGLSDAMAFRPPLGHDSDNDFTFAENDGDDLRFHKSCLEEIDRYRRADEWLPSYHNILSRAALNSTKTLAKAGIINTNPSHLIQYTRDGTANDLRLNAFSNLFEMGLGKTDAVLRWFLFALGTDPSPYFRAHAYQIFGRFLGSLAIGQTAETATNEQHQQQHDGLIIEQESSSTDARKADLARRTTVPGALAALKDDLKDNETLQHGLWTAITGPALSLPETKQLLDLCKLALPRRHPHGPRPEIPALLVVPENQQGKTRLSTHGEDSDYAVAA
ncbi:Transcription initiation factor TFIID subunit 2 [Xanthoria parietina]